MKTMKMRNFVRKAAASAVIPMTAFIVISCMEFEEQPVSVEGNSSLSLYIEFDTTRISGVLGGVQPLIAGVPVELTVVEFHSTSYTTVTDDSGWVYYTGLPHGTYKVFIGADYFSSELNKELHVTGQGLFSGNESEILRDTVKVRSTGINSGIKINEIYYMGPPNKIFYFFDQFIELCNSSDDTLYLDGVQVYRMGECTIGADNVTYAFQFPGTPVTGREYPIAPGEFKVLAQDARNHVVAQGADTIVNSIDLTNADWEFVNADDYADSDNPDVPNIGNIEVGNRNDFMIALGSDLIIIADGSDSVFTDGIEMGSILDVVEYSSNASHTKDITEELDAGFAGVGMIKYSYQSIERISPGFDTDNSTLDFKVYDYPTPGFQNE